MKGQEFEIALLIGFAIGLFVMAIILVVVTTPRQDILADGICKLKFGEEYKHTDINWEEENVEVSCETYKEPDIDSIVIRRNE